MQVGRVELAHLLQLLPIGNVQPVAAQLDQALGPHLLQHPVDVHRGEAERVGELALVIGRSQAWSSTSPTARRRTSSSHSTWAMRLMPSRRPTLVTHSRKTAASIRVSRQNAAVMRGLTGADVAQPAEWGISTIDFGYYQTLRLRPRMMTEGKSVR
jgi:hypothetical protein